MVMLRAFCVYGMYANGCYVLYLSFSVFLSFSDFVSVSTWYGFLFSSPFLRSAYPSISALIHFEGRVPAVHICLYHCLCRLSLCLSVLFSLMVALLCFFAADCLSAQYVPQPSLQPS